MLQSDLIHIQLGKNSLTSLQEIPLNNSQININKKINVCQKQLFVLEEMEDCKYIILLLTSFQESENWMSKELKKNPKNLNGFQFLKISHSINHLGKGLKFKS